MQHGTCWVTAAQQSRLFGAGFGVQGPRVERAEGEKEVETWNICGPLHLSGKKGTYKRVTWLPSHPQVLGTLVN